MGRLTAVICLVILLAGCSSVRLEETSEARTDGGRRGGVVSYRFSREQAAARDLMREVCKPKRVRIVSLNKEPAGEAGKSMANEEAEDGKTVVVRRTFVRFECELD